jgi:hypothetical protein
MKVSEFAIDGQRTDDDNTPFPLAYVCKDAASLDEVQRWVAENRDSLIEQAAIHGAVFLRGFPLKTDQDLDAFIAAFDLPNFTYEDSLSNAVRTNRTERVFTANEAPAHVNICLHHEMAQTPIFPSKLFFFCEKAAEKGGATPLCRSDVLFDRMKTEMPELIVRRRDFFIRTSCQRPMMLRLEWAAAGKAHGRPKRRKKRKLG